MNSCANCNSFISKDVFYYSTSNYNNPLCLNCQHWFKHIIQFTTQETFDLYIALKQRNVPAEIEKSDGYKTIDIAIVEARVNIEVDGGHHNFNPNQALSDLQRTYHSFLKGYLTLRIPNSLVRFHLQETADMIEGILIENSRNNNYE